MDFVLADRDLEEAPIAAAMLLTQRLGFAETTPLPRAKGDIRKDQRGYREMMAEIDRKTIEREFSREISEFGYRF